MKNGIDVSYCQTKVDWNKVKAAGIDFALIRVGYCYNNGALKIDNMFKSHMAGALMLVSICTAMLPAQPLRRKRHKRLSRSSSNIP